MMVVASRMALEEGDRRRAEADLEEAIRHDPSSPWLKLRRLEFLSLAELEDELPAWATAEPELRLRATLLHSRRLGEAGQIEPAWTKLRAAFPLAQQAGQIAPDCGAPCAEAWVEDQARIIGLSPKN